MRIWDVSFFKIELINVFISDSITVQINKNIFKPCCMIDVYNIIKIKGGDIEKFKHI